MEFKVTKDTLIPRVSSETLVQAFEQFSKVNTKRVVDLGTGSGCLLISLLLRYPVLTGVGIDISAAALDVAITNAATHKVDHRAEFHCSDMFSTDLEADVFVCNPPYLGRKRIQSLFSQLHEPELALVSGESGMEAYERLQECLWQKQSGTLLVLEVGHGKLPAVLRLFSQWVRIDNIADTAGFRRCQIFQRP